MKIFTKFMVCLFPALAVFILAMVGINYSLSVEALNKLAGTWLSGRLTEAVAIVTEQEKNLHYYGLETVPGSIKKAQVDSVRLFGSLDMGSQGYIFAVDSQGIIQSHPDQNQIGSSIAGTDWFQKIRNGERQIRFGFHGTPHLAISAFFEPWDWFVLAADPVEDYYGPANKIKPVLFFIGCLGSITIAMIIMFLVRRLMAPLGVLIDGAKQIGKGNLQTRISIDSNDEFRLLSEEFNEMTQNLQKLTVSRNQLEDEIRQKEEIEKQREKLIQELKDALNKIKTLEGMIPICAKCKKIRDDQGAWNNLEAYIEKHSEASFSHGICPECMGKLYGDKKWYQRMSLPDNK